MKQRCSKLGAPWELTKHLTAELGSLVANLASRSVPIIENSTKRVPSWPRSAVNIGGWVGSPPSSSRREVGLFFFFDHVQKIRGRSGRLSETDIERDNNAVRPGQTPPSGGEPQSGGVRREKTA